MSGIVQGSPQVRQTSRGWTCSRSPRHRWKISCRCRFQIPGLASKTIYLDSCLWAKYRTGGPPRDRRFGEALNIYGVGDRRYSPNLELDWANGPKVGWHRDTHDQCSSERLVMGRGRAAQDLLTEWLQSRILSASALNGTVFSHRSGTLLNDRLDTAPRRSNIVSARRG